MPTYFRYLETLLLKSTFLYIRGHNTNHADLKSSKIHFQLQEYCFSPTALHRVCVAVK